MDVEVSRKIKSQAKAYGITAEETALADLMACGWSIEDAWAVAVRKGLTWKKSALQEEWDRIQDDDGFQSRLADTKAQMKQRQVEKIQKSVQENILDDKDGLFEKATNKKEMIIDLQASLQGLQIGSGEWLKVKQLIVDVTRMKQEETKKDDDTIHYYLPVNYPTSCENCLMNPKNKSKKLEV